MKYIKKIDNRKLYGDGIGGVDLFDFSHANDNEESRIEAVATVASICYGKPPKDAEKLVKRLQTESGGLPSSAFEFIRIGFAPCCVGINASLRNDPRMMTLEAYARAGASSESAFTMDEMHELNNQHLATFRIKVPIFIARQVMRHRSFSYQELSRRYTTDGAVNLEWWLVDVGFNAREFMLDAYEHQRVAYRTLLNKGVPPEQARSVLGTGLYTEFWMMGDKVAWANYFKLRLDSHTQKEHRELAQAMADLLSVHQLALWKQVEPYKG